MKIATPDIKPDIAMGMQLVITLLAKYARRWLKEIGMTGIIHADIAKANRLEVLIATRVKTNDPAPCWAP